MVGHVGEYSGERHNSMVRFVNEVDYEGETMGKLSELYTRDFVSALWCSVAL